MNGITLRAKRAHRAETATTCVRKPLPVRIARFLYSIKEPRETWAFGLSAHLDALAQVPAVSEALDAISEKAQKP